MHIPLVLGGVRAEIGTVAARLRSLTIDGVHLTEPAEGDDLPPFCSGISLAPWPNRVRDARWTLDGAAVGTDLHIGRTAFGRLRVLPVTDIAQHYVVVDTLRVPRETFAGIWEAWRDGYAEVIGEHTRFSVEQAQALFDDMIACIRNPDGYAVWQVPILTAKKE